GGGAARGAVEDRDRAAEVAGLDRRPRGVAFEDLGLLLEASGALAVQVRAHEARGAQRALLVDLVVLVRERPRARGDRVFGDPRTDREPTQRDLEVHRVAVGLEAVGLPDFATALRVSD